MLEYSIEAVFFILSIVLGFAIAYFTPGQDTFLLGTLLSLSFYSVVQYLKFIRNFIRIRSSVLSISDRLVTIETRSSLRSSIIEKVMSAFEIRDSIIREAVLRGIKDFSRSISTQEDGVILQGDQLALKTYESFWLQLIDEQKKNKSENLPPLVVRVTHSTSINIWKSRRSSALLELQLKFIEDGGSILRILIRPNERKELIADYRETADTMRKFKIKVFVLELDDEGLMSYDYLVVDRLHYIFQWNSDVIGRNIIGCEIYKSDDKYSEFIGDWRTVVSSLEKRKEESDENDAWKYEASPDAWHQLVPSNT